MQKIKKLLIELENKKLERYAFLPKNAVACGIATIEREGEYFKVVIDSEAICVPSKSSEECVLDVLTDEIYKYDIYESFDEIKYAYENKKLQVGEKFCHSVYDCYEIFPLLRTMETADEVREYLRVYNRINNMPLYWSFLDEDGIEQVNKIVEENRKRYTNLQY